MIVFQASYLHSIDDTKELTRVGTAPGFWTRSALTTWKTSTTPSVLHRSMMVAIAQNIPLLVTVSLEKNSSVEGMFIIFWASIFSLSNVCCDNEISYNTQWSS